MVVLDTSIIIDHLRQFSKKKSSLDKINKKFSKKNLALSMISVQELYTGLSTKDETAENLLLATISPLIILPFTYEIAKLSGQIQRDSADSIGFADAAIAATTVLNGASLLTLNKKDFQNTKELELL